MRDRIIVITGNKLRHRFFINTLAEKLSVVGVVEERKRYLGKSAVEDDDEIIKEHFRQRDEKEEEYFKGHSAITLDKKDVLPVSFGMSNTQEVFDWVNRREPGVIVLYGCSIIKTPLLAHYEGKMINMHLGLSPYYKGAGTNFWPLVNQEPECVGVTLHLPTLQVDGGPVLGQVRPEMYSADTSHDIGCRAICAGVSALTRTIPLFLNKELYARKQSGEGRIYKNRDFNADAVRKMRENFKKGMIKEYLQNKPARDEKFPILEC